MTTQTKLNDIENYKKVINQLGSVITQFKAKLMNHFTSEKRKIDKTEGISLLDIKNELLLDYISNLAFFTLLKLRGQSTKDHPCLLKLIEIRTYLEKIKPIELKLKYQMDKLLRAYTLGLSEDVNEDNIVKDPLSFKPNPENLIAEDDKEEIMQEPDNAVYKAPKIAPVPFDDKPLSSKQEREQTRMRQSAARSRLLQDLAEDFNEGPEEQRVIGSYGERDLDPELLERHKYEEENFMRLQPNKKMERKLRDLKKGLLQNELLNLDDFRGINSIKGFDSEHGNKGLLNRIKSKRSMENDDHNNIQQRNTISSEDAFKSLGEQGNINNGTLPGNFKRAKKNFKKKGNKRSAR